METNLCDFNNKYLLESTGDFTDRKADIEEKLNLYGTCILGAGLFCVSGVVMPPSSTLMGMGSATKLLLDEGISSGAAVKMSSYCRVKNLFICGSDERLGVPEQIGERHGVMFLGTANESDWSNQPLNSIVESCHISFFNGGGLVCKDTGYSTFAALTAANCHITRCGVGIYIPHFSEYHEFTNMICVGNLYGCINNGGNNVFVNCGFNANRTGFMIDNSDGKAINNTHGSAVGCTFNHSGRNEGIGIAVYGGSVGYVFSACQIFYSKIILDNSTGITFNNCNYGKCVSISATGGELNMFTDSIFLNPVEISIDTSANVKFINCFYTDGKSVGV